MASHLQKYGYEDERFEHPVNPSFHCPICLNVLKEPKMCRNNEHVFCSACITQHLANSSTCPQCMEELTVETLHRAPRVLLNCLSEFTISCDYFSRGCREVIRLGDLQTHVISCGFAPVKCSNTDCGMEMNRHDRIHHETEVCDFRKVKCHDCGEMKNKIEGIKHQLNQLNQLPEMKDQLSEMKDQLSEMKDQLSEMKDQLNQLPELKEQLARVKALQDELSSLKEDMREVKTMMGEVLHKLNNVEHVTQVPLHVNPTKEDIVIAGGYNGHKHISSVEKFSWNKRSWAQLPPMKECRSEASSFVYDNQIIVAGGFTGHGRTDAMEGLKIDEHPLKWTESPAKLPFKCSVHKTVVYQNSLIHIGGYNDTEKQSSDVISEVGLIAPYPKKVLCRIPQPRWYLGVEIFNDKILILGGRSSFLMNSTLDSVFMYDVNKNELKQMPPLPCAVSKMATVRWGDKVVVIGGSDKDGKVLSDVLMYDSKTGESNVLPSMLHKRRECSAIITAGNVIVVMGGWNEKDKYLSSVECFTLGSNSWEELPPIFEPRSWTTAVVMPSTF